MSTAQIDKWCLEFMRRGGEARLEPRSWRAAAYLYVFVLFLNLFMLAADPVTLVP
ncbi:MAG: hypothetical protein ACTHJS_15840 [Xanthobacteraceae bacterium]